MQSERFCSISHINEQSILDPRPAATSSDYSGSRSIRMALNPLRLKGGGKGAGGAFEEPPAIPTLAGWSATLN